MGNTHTCLFCVLSAAKVLILRGPHKEKVFTSLVEMQFYSKICQYIEKKLYLCTINKQNEDGLPDVRPKYKIENYE